MKAKKYNPLVFCENLKESGLNEITAKVIAMQHAETVSEIINDTLATKDDVAALKTDVQLILAEIKSLENRMTIKFGMMMVGAIGILLTLLTLLKHT